MQEIKCTEAMEAVGVLLDWIQQCPWDQRAKLIELIALVAGQDPEGLQQLLQIMETCPVMADVALAVLRHVEDEALPKLLAPKFDLVEVENPRDRYLWDEWAARHPDYPSDWFFDHFDPERGLWGSIGHLVAELGRGVSYLIRVSHLRLALRTIDPGLEWKTHLGWGWFGNMFRYPLATFVAAIGVCLRSLDIGASPASMMKDPVSLGFLGVMLFANVGLVRTWLAALVGQIEAEVGEIYIQRAHALLYHGFFLAGAAIAFAVVPWIVWFVKYAV